jgi:hypothetical protein
LLDGDQVLFGEIEGSITIVEGSGLPEWRGRFWLPEGGRVQLGGKSGLIRDDGRAGERIVESFGPDATGGMSRCSRATAVSNDEREGPPPLTASRGVAPEVWPTIGTPTACRAARSGGTTMTFPTAILGRPRPSARRGLEGLATAGGTPRSEQDHHRLARVAADRPGLMTDRVAAQDRHVAGRRPLPRRAGHG